MFKLMYAAFLLLFSSAMFLFSRDESVPICKHDVTGIVRELPTSDGIDLYIETQDHKKIFPLIEKENLVIAAGMRIKACYDQQVTRPDGAIEVRLSGVVYLP